MNQLFLIFLICSFFGYLMETIIVSIKYKRFMDRGFLISPLCPIYGFSALFFIVILDVYKDDIINLFILLVVSASVIEYLTSYVMEKLFRVRWWDYSHLPFNLNGRIVLSNSIAFGVLGIIVIYYLNPFFNTFFNNIDINILSTISYFFLIILIIDYIVTSFILFKIRGNSLALNKDQTEEVNKMIFEHVSKQVFLVKRMLGAFPSLKSKEEVLNDIKNKILQKKRDN